MMRIQHPEPNRIIDYLAQNAKIIQLNILIHRDVRHQDYEEFLNRCPNPQVVLVLSMKESGLPA